MRQLVFLCGYDDFYFGLATMTARTIRDGGYRGDIVIFTVDNKRTHYGDCINVAAHKDVDSLRIEGTSYFHRSLCTAFGYEQYSQPFDYFVIKSLPGAFVDVWKYDFVLYMDSDMLVHPNTDVSNISGSSVPLSDYNSRDALRDVKTLHKYFTPTEREVARRIRV